MSIQAISIRDLQIIAEEVAESRLFGFTKSQAFTIGLMAQARGRHPMEGYVQYQIINGRPAMKADAMLAEFQRNGGNVKWVASTAQEATAVFRHPKHAPNGFTVTVTLDELADRGVATTLDKRGEVRLKAPYQQHPEAMLRARCVSQGVRAVDPGAILGCYTPEEIFDFPATEIRGNPPSPAPVPEPDAADDRKAKSRRRYVDPRPHRDVIETACNEVNHDWAVDLDDYDLADELPGMVVAADEVRSHLGTWALANKPIAADYLDDEKGGRSQKKLVNFLSRWHAKHPGEFEDLVWEYCRGKLHQARMDARLDGYVSDETTFNAEEENQETDGMNFHPAVLAGMAQAGEGQ